MGFRLLNNVAVAAAHLTDLGERVVVLDWDVHHGNGTQDIFWDDPAVLYSRPTSGGYPGTGLPAEVGGPAAQASRSTSRSRPRDRRRLRRRAPIETVAVPAIEAFAPTWVLVSAGYAATGRIRSPTSRHGRGLRGPRPPGRIARPAPGAPRVVLGGWLRPRATPSLGGGHLGRTRHSAFGIERTGELGGSGQRVRRRRPRVRAEAVGG